jgi:hypothetical protein
MHNTCMCHIRVTDQPEGKDLIRDVFKNDVHVNECDDAGMDHCKTFCLNTVSAVCSPLPDDLD